MSVTVRIGEDQRVRLVEDHVETRPPDRLGFVVEGTLSITDRLLGAFEGASLNPVAVELSVDDSRSVEIDLADEASLRLSSVDVGVETPDADDLSEGIDTLRSSVDDPAELADARPAALAFTVDGSILELSEETLDALSGGDPTVEAVTFAVADPLRSDGGPGDDVVLEIGLLGFGVTVRRDGSISVGTRGKSTGTDLV